MVVICAPQDDETVLIVASALEDEAAMRHYAQERVANGIGLTLESWMTCGTDHWFANPDWWSKLPSSVRDNFWSTFLTVDCDVEASLPYELFAYLEPAAPEDAP